MYIKTNIKNKSFDMTVQYLEKYSSSTGQQQACRDWHRVNRQEKSLTGGARGSREGRAEAPSAIGGWGSAAVSLMPDADGTGSGSLLEPNVCSHLWKFTTWRFICRRCTGLRTMEILTWKLGKVWKSSRVWDKPCVNEFPEWELVGILIRMTLLAKAYTWCVQG